MKLIVTLGFFLLAAVITEALDVPIFVRTFDNLFKGPPDVADTKIEGRKGPIETKWIIQKLDHFDETNNQTWRMRYMENAIYFEANGPMFIHLGGEWTISAGAIRNGIFPDLAQEHKGILFYTEHRYYGKSQPTSNMTLENLKYLHVKLALADVAHFIRYQRETNPQLSHSKVIISGGSYSATMVVWFSKLYPELVNGGWASSAPLVAKVDFIEYKEVTGKAIRELGSKQCYDRIERGINELERMFDEKRSAEAKSMLQLCDVFDEKNNLDLWTLFSSISNLFAGLVQTQVKGVIPYQCDYIMSFDDDATALASFFLKKNAGFETCLRVKYQDVIDYYEYAKQYHVESLAWYYQTCNEYGWYQSSGSRDQPFGTKFPVDLHIKMCNDIFGPNYTSESIHRRVEDTNAHFGGLNPRVKNVYMTHGALDPWSSMGQNETHGAFVIPRTSHCKDFESISEDDSPEMRASKERLTVLVREWLA